MTGTTLMPEERDVLRLARSLIRDLAHGWPATELAAQPEEVCHQISEILDEDYDFEFGEESPRPSQYCGICNKREPECVCGAKGLR